MNQQAVSIEASGRPAPVTRPIEPMPRPWRIPGACLASKAPPARKHTKGAWREWDGVLVLDSSACVTFCSTAAAELLAYDKAMILGRQVTDLIPELPFGRYTPEFNLAYVFFHGDDGLWTRRTLRTRGGHPLQVEVSIGSLQGTVSDLGDNPILLILRKTDEQRIQSGSWAADSAARADDAAAAIVSVTA